MAVRLRLLFAILALATGPLQAREPAQTGGLRILLQREADSPDHGTFEVRGLSAGAASRVDWAEGFSVRVVPKAPLPVELPSLTGSYESLPGGVRFRPRFALAPGVTYRASLRLPGEPPLERSFSLPAPTSSAEVTVEGIYPSGDELPANALRLYLHFSQPMRRDDAAESIQLLDERGQVVAAPFLTGPIGELWDRDMRRLTLLLDPGRIKRGVRPNWENGPALAPGTTRVLVVKTGMRSACGAPLRAVFRKSYRIGPAVREVVEPLTWMLTAPAPGTREPLTLAFPRPMDHGMLLHVLSVQGVAGTDLPGTCTVEAGETRWTFVPAQPWGPGRHVLGIPTAFEDVAGNNLVSALDVDAREVRGARSKSRSLEFFPAPRQR